MGVGYAELCHHSGTQADVSCVLCASAISTLKFHQMGKKAHEELSQTSELSLLSLVHEVT